MTRFALEPIETGSIDALRALQLQRLKWSLGHAYDHVCAVHGVHVDATWRFGLPGELLARDAQVIRSPADSNPAGRGGLH